MGEGAPTNQMGLTTPPQPSGISLVLEKLADLLDVSLGGDGTVGRIVSRHPDRLPSLVAARRVDLLDLLHAARFGVMVMVRVRVRVRVVGLG